jgi:hypothetical protein
MYLKQNSLCVVFFFTQLFMHSILYILRVFFISSNALNFILLYKHIVRDYCFVLWVLTTGHNNTFLKLHVKCVGKKKLRTGTFPTRSSKFQNVEVMKKKEKINYTEQGRSKGTDISRGVCGLKPPFWFEFFLVLIL